MSKALFLDRDGTLIFDKHYLADPAGVELIPGVVDALRDALAKSYRLYILTNQSGVGRGLYTLDDVQRCNDRMEELLGLPKPIFAGVGIAPEAPDQPSLYRKPSPRYLLERIAADRLDPSHCWMVGDRESDIEAGLNAGIRAAAVATGKLSVEEWKKRAIPGVAVFASLSDLVRTLP